MVVVAGEVSLNLRKDQTVSAIKDWSQIHGHVIITQKAEDRFRHIQTLGVI